MNPIQRNTPTPTEVSTSEDQLITTEFEYQQRPSLNEFLSPGPTYRTKSDDETDNMGGEASGANLNFLDRFLIHKENEKFLSIHVSPEFKLSYKTTLHDI